MTSPLICLGLLWVGYIQPNRIGWIFLIAAPIFTALDNLVLFYDPVLPLRFNQALFAVALGVAFSRFNRERLKCAFGTVTPLKFFVIFVVMEVGYGLIQPHATLFKWLLLHQYPAYFSAIILSFSLIRNEKNLALFCNALLVVALLIAFLALIEIGTGYNVSHHLCAINFKSCDVNALHWASPVVQSGSYELMPRESFCSRYAGFIGDPNRTAILLGMYMMVAFYPFLAVEPKLISKPSRYHLAGVLTLFFVLVLLMSQVRAAILAFGITGVAVLSMRRRLLSWAIVGFCIGFAVFFMNDGVFRCVSDSVASRLSVQELMISDQRTKALQMGTPLFLDSFGLGVGGTIYFVSDNLLASNDLSAFGLYFIAGGIPLGGMYLLFLGSMVADLSRHALATRSVRHNTLLILIICAIVFGLITQISNENAILFYILLFYSVGRSSMLRSGKNGELLR